MSAFDVDDCVRSLATNNIEVIQGTYINGNYMVYFGIGKPYEELSSSQMILVDIKDLPFAFYPKKKQDK